MSSSFNTSHFMSATAVSASLLAGAIYTGVKAATVVSIAAKVGCAATAVFCAGAAWGSIIAYMDSNNSQDYFEKLPKAMVATGGLLVQTITTLGLTSMFTAIFESLGKAIGDSIYEAITGKDKNAVHIHTHRHR